jgi:seryl-tRNA synthetase
LNASIDVPAGAEPEPRALGNRLLDAGLLQAIGPQGLYARTAVYELIVARLNALLDRLPAVCQRETFEFPPFMSAKDLETNGYFKNFPQLAARVFTCECAELHGEAAAVPETYRASELAPLPAACYPLYPIVAARQMPIIEPMLFDVGATCFRNEPSPEPWRLQSFRMREFVQFGNGEATTAFRQTMLDAAIELSAALGLTCGFEEASDPFFGRTRNILKAAQVEAAAKYELVARMPDEATFAIASFNNHGDMFGKRWDIRLSDGRSCSSCCNAFGLDRMAIALLLTHGTRIASWPAEVLRQLNLEAI